MFVVFAQSDSAQEKEALFTYNLFLFLFYYYVMYLLGNFRSRLIHPAIITNFKI